MTKKEKESVAEAINFIRTDNGYEQGMRLLYELIGNKAYGRFLDSLDSRKEGKAISIFNLLKKENK